MTSESFSTKFIERYKAFSKEVCEERRHFFSDESKSFLSDLYKYLDGYSEEIKEGAEYFRACVHDFDIFSSTYKADILPKERMKPKSNLRSLGRLNSYNVNVLYLAGTAEIAISESRAPIDVPISVGTFKTTRSLRLINLYKEMNWFNFNYAPYAEKPLFTLSDLFSKPLDNEHHKGREYIPTQVISEYLHRECNLDGIIYKSQFSAYDSDKVKSDQGISIDSLSSSGRNICLFDVDSAECGEINIWKLAHKLNVCKKQT